MGKRPPMDPFVPSLSLDKLGIVGVTGHPNVLSLSKDKLGANGNELMRLPISLRRSLRLHGLVIRVESMIQ